MTRDTPMRPRTNRPAQLREPGRHAAESVSDLQNCRSCKKHIGILSGSASAPTPRRSPPNAIRRPFLECGDRHGPACRFFKLSLQTLLPIHLRCDPDELSGNPAPMPKMFRRSVWWQSPAKSAFNTGRSAAPEPAFALRAPGSRLRRRRWQLPQPFHQHGEETNGIDTLHSVRVRSAAERP